MSQLQPSDEHPHSTQSDPDWVEAWLLDVVAGDASLAMSIEVALVPAERRAVFHLGLIRPERSLVTVSEQEIPPPSGTRMEMRAPALWVDMGVQTPMHHVTVDVEAFGVELDNPNDVYEGARGNRIPVGCELEWELDGDVVAGRNATSYELPCVVHGEVLVGHDVIEIDGWGWRSHRWGRARDTDRSALRGRRHDQSWWRELNHPLQDLQTIGRAPVLDLVAGRELRVDQRFVHDGQNSYAWVRSARS